MENISKAQFDLIIKKINDGNKDILDLVKEISERLKKLLEERNVLDAYQLSDVDDAMAVRYFGFVKKDGSWLIRREDATTRRWAKSDDIPRKTEEERNYIAAWTNRAILTYFRWFEIF